MAVLPPRQIGALIAETNAFGVNLSNPNIAVPFLDVAIAVCLAESGGNTAAKNPSSSASGLWQIMQSVHGSLIASQRAIYGAKKHKSLDVFDPHVNTACAGQLYRERKWQPWVAYTSGSYRRHLGHGDEAYAYITRKLTSTGFSWADAEKIRDGKLKDKDGNTVTFSSLLGAAVEGIGGGKFEFANDENFTDAASEVPDNLANLSPGNLFGFIKDAGVVIGVALFAIVLVVLGVWFIASQSSTVKKTVGAANVVPMGRAAKLVK